MSNQSNEEPPKDYQVGYGRPPKNTRFKPGRSANPSGRPKKPPSLKADLLRELAETMQVQERGRTITVTRQRGALKALVTAASRGETRAISVLLDLWQRLLAPEESVNDEATSLADDSVLDAFIEDEVNRRNETDSEKE